MGNIWNLTKANLRKSKGQTVGMVLLMLFAVMFMNIGIVLYFGVSDFFDARANDLNAPHFITLQNQTASSDAQVRFIQQYPGITDFESQAVLVGAGGVYIDEILASASIIFASANAEQRISPLTPTQDALPLDGNGIYMPRGIFLNGGHNIGETLRISFMGEILYFTIAGSTEDVPFDGLMGMPWRFYVTEAKFYELKNTFPQNRFNMLAAQMENTEDTILLTTSYMREFFGTRYRDLSLVGPGGIFFPINIETAREQRVMIPSIVAVVMTAFSLILLGVGIAVTRFRISNSVEEGMTNIGTLKAVGYRNYQIIASFVMQFGFIVLVGGLIGVAFAGVILPILTQISEPILGLPWNPGFNIAATVFSLGIVLLVVLAFSLLSSWRIKQLYPIAALRGGIGTHSFKKNPMPLDKSRGSLTLLLALKSMFQSKKQAIMICLIIAAVTFTSVSGIAMHYNFNVNIDPFVSMIGGEIMGSDVVVVLNDAEESIGFSERMQANLDVENIFGAESVLLFVDDVIVFTEVVDDFSNIIGHSLIDGRFPLHDNEIVMGLPALRAMNKEMGDWVNVRIGATQWEFIVTGIVQTSDFNGVTGMMSVEGKRRMQPDFDFGMYWIILADGVDESIFIEGMRETEANIFVEIVSLQDEVEAIKDTIGGIFDIVTTVILSVVTAAVIMVLYMVIKTTILHKRRELGIQKAVGFTTTRLMNQISLNLTPAIFIGVIIGAIAGYFGFNPIMSVMLSGLGIMQAGLIVPLNWMFILCAALLLLAYTVSMLISWRIRKISAYALVTE